MKKLLTILIFVPAMIFIGCKEKKDWRDGYKLKWIDIDGDSTNNGVINKDGTISLKNKDIYAYSDSAYGVYATTTHYDIYIADSTGMVAYRDSSGWTIKNAEAALETLYQFHIKK